jgi:predicted alpha/beta hydrolase
MTAFSPQEIATSDGYLIVGRFFVPPEAPKAAVLLVPAMGVRQEYYAPLAAWLASQGHLAATFDYRGCGLSRRGGLRGFDADIIDWAQLDCAAMPVLMPPPAARSSLPPIDDRSGSAQRLRVKTRFRSRTGDTSPRTGCCGPH